MKLSQLITGYDCPDIEITDIAFDSRKVTDGTLFICLRGETVDGHNYALMAEQKGAVAIVCEEKTESSLPHVIVADSRVAMSEIASAWFSHPEKKMRFIGITGTNGKTSTAFYVKRILDRLGKKTGMMGTVCNIICDKVLPAEVTTPEPLALFSLLADMVDAGVEFVVMEVSSHSVVQNRIHGIHYDAAVFTNLTQDHLDYHKTMENYKAAKRKLFDLCDNAVINIDDAVGK